ncbi:hypothetical protein Pan216_36150 [Planctomycetes bacterium Pan216]|uniref:ACP S-malonyltransferase n=1 Tax=Kolteria novifilia TaxID=2527975 RepID=A0A518B6Z4_9BACT|nr:hypothetical protein Pan216_36150 [Planctomycetes bacterium Pan216]
MENQLSNGFVNNGLKARIAGSAFAFRGYNVTNLGKSPELLAHPAYGPTVRRVLDDVSEICADKAGMEFDLVRDVRERRGTTLKTFARDVALIVGMEIAQIDLLKEFFGLGVGDAKLMFGYSIGELSALVAGKVFEVDQILPIPVVLAPDCAELARDVTMGILFTRGPVLRMEEVKRLCVQVSSEGEGLIFPSAYLAPNTVLLLGQGSTISRFVDLMHERFSEKVYLKRNKNRWPPMHTPLLWERHIGNRTATMLHKVAGGFTAPIPKVISCVTGGATYNDFNSRETLTKWVDHPQLLWDVVYKTLSEGVHLVIHVGPEPNLIPGTFQRLRTTVAAQLDKRLLTRWGGWVASGIVRRNPWVGAMMSSNAALLHAPFVDQIILEDWLLEQKVE